MDESQFEDPEEIRLWPRAIVVAVVLTVLILVGVVFLRDDASNSASIDMEEVADHRLEITEREDKFQTCPGGRVRQLSFVEVAARTLHKIGVTDSESESYPDFDDYAPTYVKAYRNQRDLPAHCLEVNWQRERVITLEDQVRTKLRALESDLSHDLHTY